MRFRSLIPLIPKHISSFNYRTMATNGPAAAPEREKTFQYQDQLPSLPVPDLEHTMKLYLDSVRAVASPAQYETTCNVAKEFMKGDGLKLHELLLQKAKKERNWVEKWWEDYAYLIPRYPVFPLVNFGGSSDSSHLPDPSVYQMDQANVLANHMHHMLKYWITTRSESLPVMRSRGNVWCMDQAYRYLNSCRIPQKDKDRIDHHFKLASEGPCPNHVIVLCRGHFWKLTPFDAKGVPLLPTPIEKALKEINERSKQSLPRVSALCASERNHWAQAREHLLSIAPENADILKCIESSIAVFSMTDQEPKSYLEMADTWVRADPGNIWADKCFSYMVHKNGIITNSFDHGNIDAIIPMQHIHFIFDEWMTNYREQDDKRSSSDPAVFEELKFKLDNKVVEDIEIATKTCTQLTSDIDVNIWHFYDFTNELFRSMHVYGDTVLQMALQLGYMKLHNKPAPTYETASTRKYYHGRTETVRVCQPEVVQWARTMLDPNSTLDDRKAQLAAACNKHNHLMAECTEGMGCDRHLFGLKILAAENGFKEPELYKDPGWKMSGGDGNFVLSTSFAGYTDIFGGAAAMTNDGYGIFYKMNNEKITVFTSCYKSNPDTCVFKFEEAVRWALKEIRPCLDAISRPPRSK